MRGREEIKPLPRSAFDGVAHAGARFPYKSPAGSAATGHAVEQILSRVWDETLRFAWQRARVFSFSFADAEDLTGEAMADVATVSLPAYDATRGAELETFLNFCARNAVRNHLRTLWLQRMREATAASCQTFEQLAAVPDTLGHRQADELAGAIMADPDRFLNRADADFLSALLSDPSLTKKEIARRLGMTPAACRGALSRLRRRFINLAEKRLW